MDGGGVGGQGVGGVGGDLHLTCSCKNVDTRTPMQSLLAFGKHQCYPSDLGLMAFLGDRLSSRSVSQWVGICDAHS